ncbi:MAG: hypothetical protein ACXAD7_27410 [Candidatus Kariarchaeaceae archaeon]|jgi:hypothetical protein
MERRNALKGILLLATAPAFIKVDMLMKLKTPRIKIADDITITQSGNIRWIGNNNNKYTVFEFYEYLMSTFDGEYKLVEHKLDGDCIVKETEHYMSLKKPYNIDNKMAQHLYDGSLKQDGTIYSSMYSNDITNLKFITDWRETRYS